MDETQVQISVFTDADFDRAFVYQTNDTNSTPIDLTGSTLLMMVRRQADDADVLISLTSNGGGIDLTDGVDGIFSILIRREQFQHMPASTYVHSLIRIRPDGLHEDMWHGTLSLAVGPTR